ncbi:MAG: oligosaccharide flippase family protein [Patescibacteria group bacterium]
MWKKVFKSSAIILGGTVIARIFSFLARLILIRNLSIEDYAIFAFLYTAFIWLAVFAHFDLYAGVSKFVGEYRTQNAPSKAWNYYVNAVLMVCGFSLLGIFAGVGISIGKGIGIVSLFLFFAGLLPFALSNINEGFLKGYQRFGTSTIINILTGLSLFVAFAVLAAISKVALTSALILFSGSMIIPLIVGNLFVVKIAKPSKSRTINYRRCAVRNLFHYSKWISVTDLLNSGIILYCTFVLAHLYLKDLALYNVVISIYGLFQMAFGSITTVLIPLVSARKARNESITLPKGSEFVRLIGITLIIIVGLAALNPYRGEIARLIFKNTAYADFIHYVIILVITFPFRIFTMAYKGIVQGLGQTKAIAKVAVVSFITNTILFVPAYKIWGLRGAIGSMVITYIVEFACTRKVALRLIAS